VDVEVEAVLDHLGLRLRTEPDAGAVTAGIDDAVHANSQLAVAKPGELEASFCRLHHGVDSPSREPAIDAARDGRVV